VHTDHGTTGPLWGLLKETGLSDTISERRGVRDKKSRDRLGDNRYHWADRSRESRAMISIDEQVRCERTLAISTLAISALARLRFRDRIELSFARFSHVSSRNVIERIDASASAEETRP